MRKNFALRLSDRMIYTLLLLGIVLFAALGAGIYVYAYNSGGPASTIGHTAEELDLSGGVDGYSVFNGNVGIGTTNPAQDLEISNSGGPAIRFTRQGQSSTDLIWDGIRLILSGGNLVLNGDLIADSNQRGACVTVPVNHASTGYRDTYCPDDKFMAGVRAIELDQNLPIVTDIICCEL